MPRRLPALAGLFLVLAAAAVLLWRREAARDESSPLARWTVERIVRVELARGGERTILEKKASRWRLLEPSNDWADTRAANDLAAALRSLTVGAVVSQNPSDAAAYGLDAASATRARVFVEGEAAPALDASFGAPALGATALYYRAERAGEIRLAYGLSQGALSRSPEDYREKAR